eukprot:Rhum_TRINITY_DN14181_c25_g1::Rhum_TRINITY_DN14181_c25_g1_i1::g.72590::m.72590
MSCLGDIEEAAPTVVRPSGELAEASTHLTDEEKALPAYAQRRRLHLAAGRHGLQGYVDPVTGDAVASEGFLRLRECCGDKCRHCPYNYCNVPRRKAASDTSSSCSSSTDGDDAA